MFLTLKEKVINRKRKEFRDSGAQENIDKVNQGLIDVSKIMSENFEMVLNRGKDLNRVSEQATKLRESSQNIKKSATKLKLSFWLRQYMTWIILALVLFFFFYLKFYIL